MASQGERKLWQFSIRGLLSLLVIVALTVTLLREVSIRRETTRQLDAMRSMGHVVLWAPDSSSPYSTGAGIAAVGKLFLPASSSCSGVELELFSASEFKATGTQPITVLQAPLQLQEPGYYSFHGTFQQPLGLKPGAYIVRATGIDDQNRRITGITVIQTVATGGGKAGKGTNGRP